MLPLIVLIATSTVLAQGGEVLEPLFTLQHDDAVRGAAWNVDEIRVLS